MTTNILKEIKQRRWPLLSYSLIALFFLWMYVAMYPSMAKESANITQLYKSIPKSVMQAFNIEQVDFSFAGFLASKHIDFVWPLMAILLAISSAGVALAGEMERGTIGLLLSMPVSRAKLYLAKYLGGLAVITIFTLASIPTTIPLASFYKVSVSATNVWYTTALAWIFAVAIFSIAFMLSAAVKERGKVYFMTGGLLLGMYVAKVASGLISSLNWLKYTSFFYYFNPDKALVSGSISVAHYMLFAAVATASLLVGLLIFAKRDVSV